MLLCLKECSIFLCIIHSFNINFYFFIAQFVRTHAHPMATVILVLSVAHAQPSGWRTHSRLITVVAVATAVSGRGFLSPWRRFIVSLQIGACCMWCWWWWGWSSYSVSVSGYAAVAVCIGTGCESMSMKYGSMEYESLNMRVWGMEAWEYEVWKYEVWKYEVVKYEVLVSRVYYC